MNECETGNYWLYITYVVVVWLCCFTFTFTLQKVNINPELCDMLVC